MRGVSTVKEIQEALPKLSRQEIEAIREWIDDYLEDHLELTDEVKAKLDQSRRDIKSCRMYQNNNATDANNARAAATWPCASPTGV